VIVLAEHDAGNAGMSRAALLYGEAIDGLRLYAYPPNTIALLEEAAATLQSVTMTGEFMPLGNLARLAKYYLHAAPGPLGLHSIRSSLAADLLDRNGSRKEYLTGILDRIDDAAYYARGHGSFVAMIPLYRVLIDDVERQFRFPDLEVSDWLFAFGGLLLNDRQVSEGKLRVEQSLEIEALLSDADSERIVDRREWLDKAGGLLAAADIREALARGGEVSRREATVTAEVTTGPLTPEERDALEVLRILTPAAAGEQLPVPTLFAKKPSGRTAEDLLKGLDGLVSKGLAVASHDRFTFALTAAGEAHHP
jgi:hypothetical protein